ncbi:hypothetical protein [Sphingobacterium psychroaquaticum]|uniref:Uncharacterized protein n=1 Tax=Sphingobacterium psychroaquaticum TaxID=561061 RepID=A0A1X7JVY0_9SPHI|nr:hypothetical protein [Sphingobacterium psychroaquaticum]SMG32378.1 hypothetical protein SAMN05660862_2242 [Sphingobacterium psychroaquaticum]
MAAVTGVESLEFAPIGVNGAIPTTGWVKLRDIEDGGITLNIPELATIDVRVEDVDGIRFVLKGDEEPAAISGASLDISISNANLLFNGVAGATGVEFSAKNRQIHNLAIRLTSKPFEGKKMVWVAPSAAISAGFKNNVARAGFLALSFTGKTTTPLDGTGSPVSPWGYKFVDVTLPEG